MRPSAPRTLTSCSSMTTAVTASRLPRAGPCQSTTGRGSWSAISFCGLSCLRQRNPQKLIADHEDRKSTRLNSSHLGISYAVFCLNKKIKIIKINIRVENVKEELMKDR